MFHYVKNFPKVGNNIRADAGLSQVGLTPDYRKCMYFDETGIMKIDYNERYTSY